MEKGVQVLTDKMGNWGAEYYLQALVLKSWVCDCRIARLCIVKMP